MHVSPIAHRPKDIAAGMEEDEYTGEIPNEVKAISNQFAGLPQGEIAKVFANRFRPMSLYKLRHMRGREDMYRDQIKVEDGTLRMRKVAGSYKDYRRTSVIWSEAFLNYTMIIVALFGATTPNLYLPLAAFHREIMDLSTIYEWQAAVFPLALDFHTYIVEEHPTDTIRWEIPAKWQARFCNPMTTLGSRMEQKRKRGSSPVSAIPQAKKDANDGSVFCNSFNKGVCSRPDCHRKHLCEICGLKDHGSRTCKKNAYGGASSSTK